MREGAAGPQGAQGDAGGESAAASPANGSHENGGPDATQAPPPAPQAEPAREFHAEPRDTGTHEAAPIAHFEPTPKPEAGSGAAKPYVVWSSAPAKDAGGSSRGSEE